jgi:hypothetical protein
MAGKALSCTLISLLIAVVVFSFGVLVFGVRLRGDALAFGLLLTAFALMASQFGLLVAAIGRTPQGARSVAILAVLVLVKLPSPQGMNWAVPLTKRPALVRSWLRGLALAALLKKQPTDATKSSCPRVPKNVSPTWKLMRPCAKWTATSKLLKSTLVKTSHQSTGAMMRSSVVVESRRWLLVA